VSKKILIGLAPLLAVAALVVPVAAQAVPRYFSNNGVLKESAGKFGEAGVKEVMGWGTIDLKGETGDPAMDLKCRNVVGGMVWNPVGGGNGKGETQTSAVFDCETTLCAAETVVNVVPEELPWLSELSEGGLAKTNRFRSHTEHVKIDATCNGLSAAHFEGSYQPGAPAGEDKGTGAAHPGFLEFDQGLPPSPSGELKEVELGGTAAIKGIVHQFGYAEQELIQAK
jgi:hypothetical protein